jgi:hypothetical protein
VQHERQAFGGRERLEDDQEGEPDGVGEERLVLGFHAPLGADDGVRNVRVERHLPMRPAGPEHVFKHTRAITVVSHPPRFATSLVSAPLNRSHDSWTASSASLSEPSIR